MLHRGVAVNYFAINIRLCYLAPLSCRFNRVINYYLDLIINKFLILIGSACVSADLLRT